MTKRIGAGTQVTFWGHFHRVKRMLAPVMCVAAVNTDYTEHTAGRSFLVPGHGTLPCKRFLFIS